MFYRLMYGGSFFQHLLKLYLTTVLLAFGASFLPPRHSDQEVQNGQAIKTTLRDRVIESLAFSILLTPLGAWKLSIQREKFLNAHPEEN